MTRTMRASAAGAVLLLGITACGSDETPVEQIPASEPAREVTASPSPSAEPVEDEAAEADEVGSEVEEIERDEVEGIEWHSEPSGVIAAPNGDMWQHHGTIELDALEPATGESAAGESVDCHTQFSDVSALWLRQYNDGEGGDYVYDEYGEGAEYGPTCFGEPGGSVAGPEYRLIHYVCQSAETTTRTLVAPAEGGEAVWTPEYTTGDERACFTFDDGAEVRAYQTEVTAAGA